MRVNKNKELLQESMKISKNQLKQIITMRVDANK